jgi:hypothetical protein
MFYFRWKVIFKKIILPNEELPICHVFRVINESLKSTEFGSKLPRSVWLQL